MIKTVFRYIGYFLALSGFAGIVTLNVMNLIEKREREEILTNQKLILFELGQKATKEDILEIQGTVFKLIGALGEHMAKDSASIKLDVVDFYNLFRKEFQIEFVREEKAIQQRVDSIKFTPKIKIIKK
jgi:hypothetical protein